MSEPASRPPDSLIGLDPAWSRLVHVSAIDGVGRTWHVLDNQVADASVTLLCVHGNPSWSYLFRGLLGRAPAGARVIAVDQLEMGFSERSGLARTTAMRLDDLDALTAELAIDGPVVTVGHDWGGPVSLGWAERHHRQLRGVVLMNTAVSRIPGAQPPWLIRLARSRPLLTTVAVRTSAFVNGALALPYPRMDPATRRGFRAPYLTPSRRVAIADFVADIPFEADHPSGAVLESVAAGLADLGDVPALLLWGSADRVFSDVYLHDLERRLPHCDVHRFAAAGHYMSEDVDAVGAVVDWLGALDRPIPVAEPADSPSEMLDTHPELGEQVAIEELGGAVSRRITFGEFATLVEETATAMHSAGVRRGDRVAVMIPPGIDLAVTLHACWRAAAVVVLIDAGLGPRGASAAVRAANPAYLIGVAKALAAARALRWPGRRLSATAMAPSAQRLLGVAGDVPTLRRAEANDLPTATASDTAAVVFTSGATGPSKGVVYTHERLVAQREALVDVYGITGRDRLVAAFAPFALFGPGAGVPSIVPVMDITRPGTLTASALGDAAAAIDATIVFTSPAALANVVATADELTDAHRAAFARVRLLLSAGAPVRPSLLRAGVGLFPDAVGCTPYGMTECLPITNITLDEIDAASRGDGVCVGRPVVGVQLAVRRLDDAGRPYGPLVEQAEVFGEIVVRARHARLGYDRLWHTEHLATPAEGWHATGDVGHRDADGRLWVGGRLAHVITTIAGPLGPVGAEQAIETIDGVVAAGVVGVGPRGGQQLVAFVQTRHGPRRPRLAAVSLIDVVRAVVDDPVAAVFVVGELPVDRRHNSKIDRARLAAWAERVLAGGSTRPFKVAP